MTMRDFILPQTGASAPVFPREGMGLRVTAIRWLSPSVREIALSRPDGALLPCVQAGAHLDLTLPGDLRRSYSLVNAPGERDAWRIAVNRDPASRGGSAHMVETLRVGDLIAVAPPVNAFPLRLGPAVFVAGGIGITPILAMIRAKVAEGAPWVLHYAFRAEAEAAYLPELRALPGGRLHLHDDAAEGRHFDMGTVEAPEAAHLYCCGPAPMIAAFEARFKGPRAHVEHFKAEVEAQSSAFTVVLKRKGIELQVPAGRTIIEVLLEAGIRVAYSCREGVCGSCETRVIEGKPVHRDKVLSERERTSGKLIMICCSGAEGGRLVLDI